MSKRVKRPRRTFTAAGNRAASPSWLALASTPAYCAAPSRDVGRGLESPTW